MAKIQLNGNSYEINVNTNLNELLNKLKVEIVHFIGGG